MLTGMASSEMGGGPCLLRPSINRLMGRTYSSSVSLKGQGCLTIGMDIMMAAGALVTDGVLILFPQPKKPVLTRAANAATTMMPLSCISLPSCPIFFAIFGSLSSDPIVNSSTCRQDITCCMSFGGRVNSLHEVFCGKGKVWLK